MKIELTKNFLIKVIEKESPNLLTSGKWIYDR